jgi:hypothetical protein
MQESILRFFQSIQSPALDKFFTYVTMLGEQYFIILIVAWMYWNYSKKEGFILTFLFIISSMLNIVMKAIVNTQRPFQNSRILMPKEFIPLMELLSQVGIHRAQQPCLFHWLWFSKTKLSQPLQ